MRNAGFVRLMALLASAAFFAGWQGAPACRAGDKTSASKVKIKATSEKGKDGSRRIVKLHLTLDPGWHIYANPVGLEEFDLRATRVSVKDLKGTDLKVSYPKGKAREVTGFGTYYIYEGSVTIEATVRNTNGPLEFRVQVHAISNYSCLLPGEIKLTVP